MMVGNAAANHALRHLYLIDLTFMILYATYWVGLQTQRSTKTYMQAYTVNIYLYTFQLKTKLTQIKR